MSRGEVDRVAALKGFPLRVTIGYLVVGFLWILLSDRFLAAMVSDPQRLTRLQSYKGWAYVLLTGVLLYAIVAAFARSIVRAERSAAAAELDFRRLIETTGEGVWVTDAEGRTLYVNQRLAELTGVPRDRLMREGLARLLEVPSVHGGSVPQYAEDRRIRREDGREMWVIVTQSTLNDGDGRPERRLWVVTDITARREATEELARSLELQRVLLSELNHRVRNNLASLSGIVSGAAYGHPEVEHFARATAGRIEAMGAAYSALADAGWQRAPLRTFVLRATAGAEERRVVEGPDVLVPRDRAGPLMLVLHELFANAVEHGAMKSRDGRLEIRWRRESAYSEPRVVLEWEETGGPPIESPPERGFGLHLAEGMARSDLRGELNVRFDRAGVRAQLTMVLDETPGVVVRGGSGELKSVNSG